ncbi:MAG: GTPase ObgE [Dehalococcoidia bacterium]|nr:GTPase ObgE [Dehalococcoidia bacterium]
MLSRVEVLVRGGEGGAGLVSFHHEKFVPFGGPDGGDGGAGGDVFVVADPEENDLGLLKGRKKFAAGDGTQGGSWQKHGKRGKDLTILVPMGTIVFRKSDLGDEVLLADLTTAGEQVLLARGGHGGLGNAHFATAVTQVPETAGKGEPGEEQHIILELKLPSDICIIGYPNSGKSTLLATISRARPQIADYPFTTRQPILGVIQGSKRDFIVTEMPGLVEGAHDGKGLGNDFLRHAERTRLLLYLLDGSSATIADDLKSLRKELALYKANLLRKPEIVVVNKVDLPQVQTHLPGIRQNFAECKAPLFYVSAASGQGVLELTSRAMEIVEREGQGEEIALPPRIKVFRPRPKK